MCVCVWLCIYMYNYIYIYICVCVSVCVCVHIKLTCTHMYKVVGGLWVIVCVFLSQCVYTSTSNGYTHICIRVYVENVRIKNKRLIKMLVWNYIKCDFAIYIYIYIYIYIWNNSKGDFAINIDSWKMVKSIQHAPTDMRIWNLKSCFTCKCTYLSNHLWHRAGYKTGASGFLTGSILDFFPSPRSIFKSRL